MDSQNILIIDDDSRLRELIKSFLKENGFVASGVENAAKAEELLQYLNYDLIILDQMMPQKTGTEFLQDLREKSNTPVIMLTAMGDAEHRITGLENGADDYISKPFEPKELLLRIRSILRRIPHSNSTIKIGDYTYSSETASLKNSSTTISLTTAENDLIKTLVNAKGEILSRDELAKKFATNERTIDVLITRLRKKIGDDSKKSVYIHTIRGKGYKIITS